MPRDYRQYLDDIVVACERILRYTQGMSAEEFRTDDRTFDAVVRNLEIIGEAAKGIPEPLRARAPNIEWQKIVAFRNVLVHAYFGVSVDIVWDVAHTKLASLRHSCRGLLSELGEGLEPADGF